MDSDLTINTPVMGKGKSVRKSGQNSNLKYTEIASKQIRNNNNMRFLRSRMMFEAKQTTATLKSEELETRHGIEARTYIISFDRQTCSQHIVQRAQTKFCE